METLRIEIINPKAKSVIRGLADMNLIRIKKVREKSEFSKLLTRLRKNSGDTPSLDEITREVESDRIARYEEQKNNH